MNYIIFIVQIRCNNKNNGVNDQHLLSAYYVSGSDLNALQASQFILKNIHKSIILTLFLN